MIGHLYRYPHPHDPTRFIYVGQGAKRDWFHRFGESSFGRRFKKDFSTVELPQPIREQVEVKDYLELNELETIWMFQYHTWRGYEGGMNLTFPGSHDYKSMAHLGGLISGRMNVENGHLARLRTPENQRKAFAAILSKNPNHQSDAAAVAGRKNVESGWAAELGRRAVENGSIQELGRKYGKLSGQRNVKSGQIQELGRIAVESGRLASFRTPEHQRKASQSANHNRWHVKRNIVSPTCSFCQQF